MRPHCTTVPAITFLIAFQICVAGKGWCNTGDTMWGNKGLIENGVSFWFFPLIKKQTKGIPQSFLVFTNTQGIRGILALPFLGYKNGGV